MYMLEFLLPPRVRYSLPDPETSDLEHFWAHRQFLNCSSTVPPFRGTRKPQKGGLGHFGTFWDFLAQPLIREELLPCKFQIRGFFRWLRKSWFLSKLTRPQRRKAENSDLESRGSIPSIWKKWRNNPKSTLKHALFCRGWQHIFTYFVIFVKNNGMEHWDFQIRGFYEICPTRSTFLSRLTRHFDLFFSFL